MKRNPLVAVAAVLLCGSMLAGLLPATSQEKTPANWMRLLVAPNASVQKLSVKVATDERDQQIQTLEAVLRQEPTKQNRPQIAAAIQIAGKLRAGELSEVLLDKIDFIETVVLKPFTRPSDEGAYISKDALIAIGNVALKPTLERLSTLPDSPPEDTHLDNEYRRGMFVAVIHKIAGKRAAQIMLEEAIERAEGEKKQNLEKALKILLLQRPLYK